MSLRKVIKTRGSFPNEEAATKLLYLALQRATPEMDAAGRGLEGGAESVCNLVRGPAAKGHIGMNSSLLTGWERARQFSTTSIICP